MELITILITSTVTLIIAIPTFYTIGAKKNKIEIENEATRVDTIEKYQKMAFEAYNQTIETEKIVEKLKDKIDEHASLIANQEKQIIRMNETITYYKECIADWQKGVERLIEQLEANRLVPDWKPDDKMTSDKNSI